MLFVGFFCRPLPHFRTRPHWTPPGNPEYARNTLKFPKNEESCRMGMYRITVQVYVDAAECVYDGYVDAAVCIMSDFHSTAEATAQ